jgi:hypothetical protein
MIQNKRSNFSIFIIKIIWKNYPIKEFVSNVILILDPKEEKSNFVPVNVN